MKCHEFDASLSYDSKTCKEQAIYKIYHGENNLHFDEMMMMSSLYMLDFYSANSLKQQSTERHVASLH